jgi:hypothetical protein
MCNCKLLVGTVLLILCSSLCFSSDFESGIISFDEPLKNDVVKFVEKDSEQYAVYMARIWNGVRLQHFYNIRSVDGNIEIVPDVNFVGSKSGSIVGKETGRTFLHEFTIDDLLFQPNELYNGHDITYDLIFAFNDSKYGKWNRVVIEIQVTIEKIPDRVPPVVRSVTVNKPVLLVSDTAN